MVFALEYGAFLFLSVFEHSGWKLSVEQWALRRKNWRSGNTVIWQLDSRQAFHKNKITLQTRANEHCTLDFSSTSSFQSSFVNTTDIFRKKFWNSLQTDSFVVSFLRITGLFQFTWKIHWSSRDWGRTNAKVGLALTTVKQEKSRKYIKARFITINGQNPTKLKALVVDTCSASYIYGRVLIP